MCSFVLFWSSCTEDPEDNGGGNSDSNENTSTLDDNLSGEQANLRDDLFFNFENNINYSYDYYSVDGIGYANTIDLPCSIRETDLLNFYTFPEYLIEALNCSDDSIICGEDDVDYENYVNNSNLDETYNGVCSCWCVDDEGYMVDCGSQDAEARVYSNPPTEEGGSCQNSSLDNQVDCESFGWTWFTNTVDCSVMDANQDCVMDEFQETNIINAQEADFSVTYTNLEKMSWDEEAGRYKTQVSEDQTIEVTIIDSSDVYNTSNYWTIINEWEDINGMVYIDHAQWNDTTLLYEEQPIGDEDIDIIIDTTFTYSKTILNLDSLMFRVNSDCNNDGIWTVAEDYEDVGIDGCPDIYEDSNGGCVCNYPDDCSEEDEQSGDDPNTDNWQENYDILIYTDGNMQYDEGEPFTDRLDGLIEAEIFWDIPVGESEEGNGVRDGLEPWADLNCNNIYDSDSENSGNGIWDDDEIFQDLNGNGEWDEGEPLYSVSASPNQIIVNYDTNGDQIVDQNDGPPQVINEIDPDEINSAMVYLNNDYVFYDDIITEESFESYQYYQYTPIEEIVTIYSNELIEDIPSSLMNDDYYITKTYWETQPQGTDVDGDGIVDRYYDYDYHLFRYNDEGHLTKLIHPAYFYHYGYFETPEEMEDGFYETSELIQDVIIYTSNGDLREGERITSFEEITVDSNNDGVNDMQYEVSKEFDVEYEEVIVPLRQQLGEFVDETHPDYNCSEGQMIICSADGLTSCPDASNSEWGENDCGEKIKELTDCSSDTTLNAYKVIRTKNILMVGNGVEFGERNTIWLAQNIGIIKDKLEHRWTEDYWAGDDALDWKEFSRLELKSLGDSDGNSSLGRLFNNYNIIHIDDFESEEVFNNDPYFPTPTAIIQRIRIPNE